MAHNCHGKIIFVTAKSFWPRQNHSTAKSFLSRQNHFGHGKIIFVTAKSFWPRQNHFRHGKIIFVTAKLFWPRQNHFRHGKIIFVTAKLFWPRQNHFRHGKIIFNQGKYILYARDLCSSYKMVLEGLCDSHFTSLYAAPYLGLLTKFASCAFVVGLVGGFPNGQLSRYNLDVVFLRLCSRGHI